MIAFSFFGLAALVSVDAIRTFAARPPIPRNEVLAGMVVPVVELMILGFLASGPLHGYELRRRMEELHGYARTLSDGTVYPAIDRLLRAGHLTRTDEPGTRAAARKTLHLTESGRVELLRRLRSADGLDITDLTRFYVVLAFLNLLPEREERDAVLRRRYAFLDQPASFFYDADRPVAASETADPYRRGMLLSARALSRAERAWIRAELATSPDAGTSATETVES